MDKIKVLDFDWSLELKKLRYMYGSTGFEGEFLKFIANNVIKVLSPQLVAEPHNLIYDDEIVYKQLLGPLERFICDVPLDAPQAIVDEKLNYLKTLKQPSKVCRKVLKSGDVFFSCKDCGVDGTCVVCIDCFHKSAHKDHSYRMSNSEGGGCCDCGDPEAWRQYPACSDHQADDQFNLKPRDFEDVTLRQKQLLLDKEGIIEKFSALPNGFASRYFMICQAALHYARKMIAYDSQTLPVELDPTEQAIKDGDEQMISLLSQEPTAKNFFTVLYNDEVHTYDHVISTLVKVIRCSKMTASIMASSVSREGRSLILQDAFKRCEQVSNTIAGVRDSNQGPLKVKVVHGSILAHQAYALKLIEWIKQMSSVCDAFRILTAYTLLGPYDLVLSQDVHGSLVLDYKLTLLEKIMRQNTTYWKIARILWNELFVTTLFTEYSIKEQFARLVTRIYPDLVIDFIKDDHDHSVSILTMTTQLYTVPSLVSMLVEEENALTIIAQKLIEVCDSTKREDSSITFDNRNTFDMHYLKRGFYMISDMRHLISFEPSKWTDKLRQNVIQAVKIFLNLLESMQNMDSVKRQLGQHMEYEQEWETGMTLQSRLISLITELVKYCSYDEIVLTECLRETQRRLFDLFTNYKTIRRELFGHEANCIQYDVSLLPVSVHLPLTRFAAALIIELMKKRPSAKVPYDESLVILTKGPNNDGSMVSIMEPSLRTEVMITQFRSGMWRRNGYSLVNQIVYFSGALMRKEMYDRDILVLQECAATCEANQFLIHMINKFNLICWVTLESPLESMVSRRIDEEVLTQTMSIGEGFLQLLLTIVGERYREGIGKVSEDDVIKNEIIQLLCLGPLTRSDITQKLFYSDREVDCIKLVADLRRSGESATGKYELKKEFYDRFNPFFYHYNRQHQSHALDAQLKRKRNANETLICCPPPVPVELTPQFRNLNNLLTCDIMLLIIKKILQRANLPTDNAGESSRLPMKFTTSDLQLDQCLHLIGLGLHEQERNLTGYSYLEAAEEKQVWSQLKECYETAKRSRDLIFWLMRKASMLIDKLESQETHRCTQSEGLEGVRCNYDSIKQHFNSILGANDSNKQESKKRNSELAAQRRERIMAMMKAKQDKFLSNPATRELAAETTKNEAPKSLVTTTGQQQQQQQQQNQSSIYLPPANVPLDHRQRDSSAGADQMRPTSDLIANEQASSMDYELTNSNVDDDRRRVPGSSCRLTEDSNSITMLEADDDEQQDDEDDCHYRGAARHIMTSENRSNNNKSFIGSVHMCIFCRDEQVVAFDKPTMVLLAYVQRSAVLSKSRGERRIPNYSLTPSNQLKHISFNQTSATKSSLIGNAPEKYSYTSDNGWSFDATHMPADLFFGPYVSTCGHAMHYDCWQGFSDDARKRETARTNRSTRHVSFELEKNEILCPLCDCISNATIPLLPDYTRFSRRRHSARGRDSSVVGSNLSVFNTKSETIEQSAENLTAFLHALKGTVSTYKHVRHLNTSSTSSNQSAAAAAAASGSGFGCSSSSPSSSTSSSLTGLSTPTMMTEDKYMRLLQPTTINDVLKELDEHEALVLRDFIATIRNDTIQSSICTKNLLGSIQALAERIHSIGLDLDRSIVDVNHARVFMMTSWSISYTIQAHERAARFKGTPLFEDLESSKNLCLSSLVRFACTSMMTHQSDTIQSLLVQKLRYLLISEEHLMSSPCVLDIDAFELFVSIFVMLQKLYSHTTDDASQVIPHMSNSTMMMMQQPMQSNPLNLNISSGASGRTGRTESEIDLDNSTSSSCISLTSSSSAINCSSYAWTTCAYDHEYFRNLLHLMVIFNLLQIIITNQSVPNNHDDQSTAVEGKGTDSTPGNLDDDQVEDSTTNSNSVDMESMVLHNFYKDIILASGHPKSKLHEPGKAFVKRIKCALLPFLRSCAIFFYQLSHVKPNELLRTKSAFNEGKDFVTSPVSTSSSSSSSISHDQGANKPSQTIVDGLEEFNAICQYLNLPNDFSLLLRSRESRNLALTWMRHSRVLLLINSSIDELDKLKHNTRQQAEQSKSAYLERVGSSSSSSSSAAAIGSSSSSSNTARHQLQQHQQTAPLSSSDTKNELILLKLIRQPHLVNRLIDLPYNYSELVDKVSNFTCPSIKNENSPFPTMCLVCGAMLCSQSYCCQYDLNDLASNYEQVIKRQEEFQQQWLAANAAIADSGSASGVGAIAGGLASGATGQHGYPQGSAAAAAATLHSGALTAISLLFPQAGRNLQAGAVPAAIAAHQRSNNNDNRLGLGSSSSGSNYTSIYNSLISQQLVGSCAYHAYECSGGVGVFLRVRNCEVLLLSGHSKGCYMAAPYIDDHGETDSGLMRGRPMHLNRRLYMQLQQLWMNHGIPEQISRKLEHSPYASSINWHLH